METIDVNTGDVAVNSEASLLRATAIGSCIVVAAYDSKNKIAGMVHIMFPNQATERTCKNTRYAFDGIEQMIALMADAGSQVKDIEVCLVGAGNVLQKEDDSICRNNITSVTSILAERGIPIRASILGGSHERVFFWKPKPAVFVTPKGTAPKHSCGSRWRQLCCQKKKGAPRDLQIPGE